MKVNNTQPVHTGNGTGPSRITNPSIMCVRIQESGLSGSLLITVKGLSADLWELDAAVIAVVGFIASDCETFVDGATTAAGKAMLTAGCNGNGAVFAAVTQVGVTVAEGGAAVAIVISCETVKTVSGRAIEAGTDWIKVCGVDLPTTLTTRPSAVTDNSGIEAVGSKPVRVGAGLTNCPLTSDGDSEPDNFSVSVKTLDMSVEQSDTQTGQHFHDT
jgi:hypothetical protein